MQVTPVTNPYYVTYLFRDKALGNGDVLRLKIIFTVNTDGTDITINAEDDDSIYISDPGYKETEYGIEDFLLTPSYYSPKLSAPDDSNFIKYLFALSGTVYQNTIREAQVILLKQENGSTTFKNEFNGNIILKSINYDPDTSYLTFEAAPDMSILSRTLLFDLDGNALDPLGYGVPDPYDPENHPCYISLKTFLLDCYRLVNPNFIIDDLIIEHDWKFFSSLFFEGSQIYDEYDLEFQYVNLPLYPMFHASASGFQTLADLLKQIAKEFASFTGINDAGEPFFKKLYNTANPITLSSESYYSFNKSYDLNKIVYSRITSGNVGYDGGTLTQTTYHYPSASAFTGLTDTYIEFVTILVAHNNTGSSISKYNILYGSPTYSPYAEQRIYGVKDDSFEYNTIGEWFTNSEYPKYVPLGQLQAAFWYNHRSSYLKCRKDKIITPTDVKITDSFIFNGIQYQPLRVKRYYKDCKTEIEGSIIKSLEYDAGTPSV